MQEISFAIRELAHVLRVRYAAEEATQVARHLLGSVYGEGIWKRPWAALPFNHGRKAMLNLRLRQVLQGMPVQYACRGAFFLSRWMRLGPGVFIPRPETEEWMGRLLSQSDYFEQPQAHILDIGTGSGCIAISVALAYPKARVVAIDSAAVALNYARQNAQGLGVSIQWIQKCIQQLPAPDRPYTLMLSNPPYVPFADRMDLAPHVRDHEPWMALFASDKDPLAFYRLLADYALRHLAPACPFAFEVHAPLAVQSLQIFAEHGFQHLRLHPDLHQRPRLLTGTAPA